MNDPAAQAQRTNKELAIEGIHDAISNMKIAKHCLKGAGESALIPLADLKQVMHRIDCLKQLMEMGD